MMKSIGTVLVLILSLFVPRNDQYPNQDNWYKSLPACPCINPDRDRVRLGDGWARDIGNLSKYHKGASMCFRSYPYVNTVAGNSCQQCCYDQTGLLIKTGAGAGTPDKVSTCAGENDKGKMKTRFFALMEHYFRDVRPWNQAGSPDNAWKTYNKQWVPSQGDCDSVSTK